MQYVFIALVTFVSLKKCGSHGQYPKKTFLRVLYLVENVILIGKKLHDLLFFVFMAFGMLREEF